MCRRLQWFLLYALIPAPSFIRHHVGFAAHRHEVYGTFIATMIYVIAVFALRRRLHLVRAKHRILRYDGPRTPFLFALLVLPLAVLIDLVGLAVFVLLLYPGHLLWQYCLAPLGECIAAAATKLLRNMRSISPRSSRSAAKVAPADDSAAKPSAERDVVPLSLEAIWLMALRISATAFWVVSLPFGVPIMIVFEFCKMFLSPFAHLNGNFLSAFENLRMALEPLFEALPQAITQISYLLWMYLSGSHPFEDWDVVVNIGSSITQLVIVFQYIDDLSKAYLVSRWTILLKLISLNDEKDVPFLLLLRKWPRVDYGPPYVRNGLIFTPQYIEQISSALSTNTKLTALRFRRRQMSFDNLLQLCPALQANTSLRSFVRAASDPRRVRACMCSSVSLCPPPSLSLSLSLSLALYSSLSFDIRKSPAIRQVIAGDLHDKQRGKDGHVLRRDLPREFAAVLARPNGLKHLTLEQFELECEGSKDEWVVSGGSLGLTWKGLFEALGRSKSLVTLSVRSDAPDEVDLSTHEPPNAQNLSAAATKALLSVRTLSSLSLTYTHTFGVLEGLLRGGLNTSKNIARLDLSHSSVDSKALTGLYQWMRRPTLRTVLLHNLQVRPATEVALSNALCSLIDALRDPNCAVEVLLATLRVGSDSRDLAERAELLRMAARTSRKVHWRARRVFEKAGKASFVAAGLYDPHLVREDEIRLDAFQVAKQASLWAWNQVFSCLPLYESDPEVVLADLVKEANGEAATPTTRDTTAAVQLLAESTSLVSALLIRRHSAARAHAIWTVLAQRALLQPLTYVGSRNARAVTKLDETRDALPFLSWADVKQLLVQTMKGDLSFLSQLPPDSLAHMRMRTWREAAALLRVEPKRFAGMRDELIALLEEAQRSRPSDIRGVKARTSPNNPLASLNTDAIHRWLWRTATDSLAKSLLLLLAAPRINRYLDRRQREDDVRTLPLEIARPLRDDPQVLHAQLRRIILQEDEPLPESLTRQLTILDNRW